MGSRTDDSIRAIVDAKLRVGDWRGLGICRRALRDLPRDFDLLIHQTELLVRDGHLEEARTIADCLAERHPDSAEPHYFLGVVETLLGNLERASERVELAARLDPHLFQANYFRADIAIRLGRPEEALRIIDTDISRYGNDLRMECHLMFLRQLRNQLDEE